MKKIIQSALIIGLALTLTACPRPRKDNTLELLILAAILSQPKYSVVRCSNDSTIPKSNFILSQSEPIGEVYYDRFKGFRLSDIVHNNEILVQFKDGIPETRARGILKSVSRENNPAIKRIPLSTPGKAIHSVRINSRDFKLSLKELQNNPDVLIAEPNYIRRISAAPNDPEYGKLWGMKNTGQTVNSTNGTPGKDMNVQTAWDNIAQSSDCSSVTVAVIDTGVNYNHEDLLANMWDGSSCVNASGNPITGGCPKHGYDFAYNDKDPSDMQGHGTHVAGTIGAVGNNTKGVAGVCHSVKIMAVKVLGDDGTGNTAGIIQGIDFAVKNGAHILNMSLGSGYGSTLEKAALERARNAGVLVLAAAGNEAANNDTTGSYPANYDLDNIISVAAMDQDGQLSDFSNYGTECVEVAAPGVNIYSTYYALETELSLLTSGTDFTKTPNGGSTGWGEFSCNFSSGTYEMIGIPSNWCSNPPPHYGNNLDAKAVKAVPLNSYNKAYLSYYAEIYTAGSGDVFSVGYNPNNSTVFGDANSVLLDSKSGHISGFNFYKYDISNCNTANCNIGFRFVSDASGTDYGVGIVAAQITGISLVNNQYKFQNGTSMATPMVSGLAAMLKAHIIRNNKSCTYRDIRKAILDSADQDIIPYYGNIQKSRRANAYAAMTALQSMPCWQ